MIRFITLYRPSSLSSPSRSCPSTLSPSPSALVDGERIDTLCSVLSGGGGKRITSSNSRCSAPLSRGEDTEWVISEGVDIPVTEVSARLDPEPSLVLTACGDIGGLEGILSDRPSFGFRLLETRSVSGGVTVGGSGGSTTGLRTSFRCWVWIPRPRATDAGNTVISRVMTGSLGGQADATSDVAGDRCFSLMCRKIGFTRSTRKCHNDSLN